MASAFNLTAQLQLQAPTNTAQVLNQVKSQLSGANLQLQVQANSKAVNQVNQALQQTTKSANNATKASKGFASALTSAAKRFSIFAGATGVLFSIGNAFKRSAKDALAFEETLRKITQITGKSSAELGSLVGTINSLSTGLGVASGELLNVAKTLSQAGFSARDTERALNILAKTTLTSSFDDIIQTTEGAIAVLRQFEGQARATGDEIRFLESTLGAINQVSKRFAVESSDIIAAIRRTGGVFAAAGGEVEELIALFTSVRATTRETAETIATGLRTIFTRLQRTDTVDALKALGIELRTLDGAFVGPFEAIQRIQRGLAGLDPRDFRFAEIVEELGGIRQIGKLIPLIQANTVAQRAYNEARRGGNSINEDAATTQDLLTRRIRETGERFDELIRKFTASQGFRDLAEAGFRFADALIKITESIIPLIPLITQLLTVTATVGIGKFALGKFGIGGKNSGGKIHRFARGGFVPGSGNTDSVPAMLQPGEFVIKKSSAQSLGADTLNRMNNNRFNDGPQKGRRGVRERLAAGDLTTTASATRAIGVQAVLKAAGDNDPADGAFEIGGAFLQPKEVQKRVKAVLAQGGNLFADVTKGLGNIGGAGVPASFVKDTVGNLGKNLKLDITSGSFTSGQSKKFRTGLRNSLTNFGKEYANVNIPSNIKFNNTAFKSAYRKINLSQVEGGIFEAFVAGLANKPLDDAKVRANAALDFPQGLGAAGPLFGLPGGLGADAKRTFSQEALSSLTKKAYNTVVSGLRQTLAQTLLQDAKTQKQTDFAAARTTAATAPVVPGAPSTLKRNKHFGGIIRKFATGGGVGTDTVPALLTPGEFVINRKSAQSIGYGKLDSMNQTGTARFATGGAVGVQKFLGGGVTLPMGSPGSIPGMSSVAAAASGLQKSFSDVADSAIAAGRGLSPLGKFKEKFAGVGAQLNTVGSNMTNVALSVGIAASLFNQLGKDTLGLSDTQAEAAQAAISMGTVILTTVGSILQMTTANIANTVATEAETTAKVKSAASSGGMVKAFSGIVIAATILISIFTYFSTKAKAEADKLAKAVQNNIKSLKEQGSNAGISKEENFAATQRATSAQAGAAAANQAQKAGYVGMGAGAAIGFGVGGPLGAVIGLIVGGLAAWGAALFTEQDRIQAAMMETAESFRSMTDNTYTVAKAMGDLNSDFAEAGKIVLPENATAEQRTQAEADARQRQADVVTRSLQSAGGAEGIAQQQEKSAAILGPIAAKLGKSISDLTEEDISKASTSGTLSPSDYVAATESLRNLRTNAEYAAQAQGKLNEILDRSAQAELDGTKSFEQVIQGNSAFAQNLRNSENIIKAQARARIAELSQNRRLAATAEDRAKIDAEIARVNQEAAQDIQDTRSRFKELNEAAAENRQRFEEEQKIRAAIIKTQKAFDKFGAGLISATNGLAQIEQAANNAVAALGTGIIDFSTIAPEDIADFSNVQNAADKAAEASVTARGLGRTGAALASQVGRTAGVAERAQAGLVGQRFTAQDKIRSEEILDGLGINRASVGPELFNAIQKRFNEAVESGETLDLAAVNEIIAPAVEQGQQAGEQLAKLNSIRNKEIKIYQNFVNQLESQRDKELAAYQKFINVQEKNADILAKAGVRGAVTRQEREGFRTAGAQTALNFAGTGTRAGDVGGNAFVLAQAQERKTRLEADVKAGRISEDQAINQQAALNRQIKATTDELSRLADQSAKVSDIQSEIEKEQKKRGAVAGIAEDFVFGGRDTRKGINQGLAGVQAAVATGTVQNQSEEQRKQTLSMLDKLQDVVVGPGGLTGKQVKEQIIQQDAARLGLPPEIAKALFDPTSKEEQLQQELIAVTQQQTAAAAALAQQETDNTNRLLTQQQQLIQNIANLNNTLQQSGGGIPMAFGGRVRGTDTVPAMLTPGEFVMSRPAVESVGIGTLTAMNQGVSSPVMSNGVAYAYMGGAMPSAYRSAGAAAQQRKEEELDKPIRKEEPPKPKPKPKPFYSGISQQVRENQQVSGLGGFNEAIASSAQTSDEDVFAVRSDEDRKFNPNGFGVAPTYVQPVENKPPLPIRSVADNAVTGRGSSYYARQAASERIKQRRAEQNTRRQEFFQGQQTRQQTAMQVPTQQQMPVAPMRAAPPQMTGGQNMQVGGNNMVGAMNNMGNQSMSFNHKVDVTGLIALGGLNIDSVSGQITNAIGQFVVAKVKEAMRDPTSFRSG